MLNRNQQVSQTPGLSAEYCQLSHLDEFYYVDASSEGPVELKYLFLYLFVSGKNT